MKLQNVSTQKSQAHSSLMAPGDVARLFSTRRSCTMSVVKGSLLLHVLGAALPQFFWKVGALATRGLVYQFPCLAEMSHPPSMLRARVQMCCDRHD